MGHNCESAYGSKSPYAQKQVIWWGAGEGARKILMGDIGLASVANTCRPGERGGVQRSSHHVKQFYSYFLLFDSFLGSQIRAVARRARPSSQQVLSLIPAFHQDSVYLSK